MFELIFLGGLIVGWLICAYVPWLIRSVLTRGHAGLGMLPLCLVSGLVGAFAVPLLGFDGAGGLRTSFVVAAAIPAALLLLRQLTRTAPPATGEPRQQESE